MELLPEGLPYLSLGIPAVESPTSVPNPVFVWLPDVDQFATSECIPIPPMATSLGWPLKCAGALPVAFWESWSWQSAHHAPMLFGTSNDTFAVSYATAGFGALNADRRQSP